jgi:hypothetical protein
MTWHWLTGMLVPFKSSYQQGRIFPTAAVSSNYLIESMLSCQWILLQNLGSSLRNGSLFLVQPILTTKLRNHSNTMSLVLL